MGWEQRGNSQYYYRKERDGKRVKSVYVGRGELAQMVSLIQSDSPLIERLARRMASPQAIKQERAEAELEDVVALVKMVTQAALLSTGFHTHKRQWRKMRDGGKNNRECRRG
jgi:hypothetical protein